MCLVCVFDVDVACGFAGFWGCSLRTGTASWASSPKRSDGMNFWYIWTLEYKMHLSTLPEITVIVPIYLRYAKCSFDSRCNLQLLWTFVCLWEILSLPYSQSSCAIWREMHACYRCIWQFLLGEKTWLCFVPFCSLYSFCTDQWTVMSMNAIKALLNSAFSYLYIWRIMHTCCHSNF